MKEEKFIVLEGLDGSGKTEVINRLKLVLKKGNFKKYSS